MRQDEPALDLGDLSGRVLIFGGPYSNLEATRAMRAEAKRLGISAARTICTGDVVAYCGDPAATVAEIRDWGIPVVMGNCEESLAEAAADCGCGFEEGSACAVLSVDWYSHANAVLGAEDRAWMAGLPRRISFRVNAVRLLAIHGGVSSINRFVFASTPDAVKSSEMQGLHIDGIVAGHCGLPFTQIVAGRLWHNAGAIGLPANDGTTEVWYALIEPDGAGIAITHRRLAYDVAAAAASMRHRRLPDGYALALETGLWPSLDVLPAEERQATGRKIAPPHIHFTPR
ncbi:MAG: metallophosphoesterase [Alphaproteobacteria bacterium]